MIVLYEDRRAVGGREFGPHAFVLGCVADRLGGTMFDPALAAIEARPLNGVGNLLLALRFAAPSAWEQNPLFALIDGDEAWRHLNLQRSADDSEVVREALAGAPSDHVHVFVLRENLETLIHAVAVARGLEWDPGTRLSLDQRDRMLIRAARDDPPDLRERVLERVPAVSALVDALVRTLSR